MKPTGPVILRNSIRTPDGTDLVSEDRRDYQSHLDANGKTYVVDGGNEYLRRTSYDDHVDTSVMFDGGQPFSLVREHMKWGSYGKDGKSQKRMLSLGEMDTDHIEAVLETQKHISKFYRAAFLMELALREKA